MAILRSDFPALTEYLDEIFNDEASAAVEQMVGPTIFESKDTPFFTFDYQANHGLNGIQKVAEGADYPKVNNQEGRLPSFFRALASQAVA